MIYSDSDGASIAQEGLALIKRALLLRLRANPNGLTNTELAKGLGFESDHGEASRNYLTFSVLGLLIKDGSVSKRKVGARVLYFAG